MGFWDSMQQTRRAAGRPRRAAAIVVMVALGAGASTAQAATFTVTRPDDPSSGTCAPTSCSLRQAVAAAGDGDTVLLPANTSHYTITTAGGGAIVTSKAITIQGAGATSSVIDVQSGNRGFLLGTGSGGTATVAGVTIEGATASALYADMSGAFLIVRDSVLTGNSATSGGAIYALGGLQVIDSTLSGNSATFGGGAISAGGVTTISGSAITGNSVTGSSYPEGGGIFSHALLSIADSTIAHNTVDVSGGSSNGFGGGVGHGGSGSLTITNSTIAENVVETTGGATGSAYGGGLRLEDSAVVPDTILFSTIAGNSATGTGGNIDQEDTMSTPTVQGSIIANGTAPSGADCSSLSSPALQTAGYNVESLDACGLAHGSTDLPNTNPMLGALQANGGPTSTMALLAGSPAIDLAPATGANCPATDQRGISRPQPAGGRCDAGAYEYAPPTCQAVSAGTIAGRPVAVQLSCSDPAGLAVTYALGAAPAHGALSGLDAAAGKVTYTPAAGYSGSDSFTYHATSNNGGAVARTVTITVKPPPSCRPLTASAIAGRATRIQLRCSDASGAPVTYVLDRRPSHGALSAFNPATGTVTYTAAARYSGPDSFTYHATSADGTAAVRTVSIRVTGPPVISHARLTNQRFRVGRAGTPITAARAPFGTAFRFSLSTAAKVVITIIRRVPGRHGLRVGTLTRAHEPPGSDSISFSGRIGHLPLAPGSYRAILVARNSAGHSRSVTLTFVIVS